MVSPFGPIRTGGESAFGLFQMIVRFVRDSPTSIVPAMGSLVTMFTPPRMTEIAVPSEAWNRSTVKLGPP